VIGETIGSYKLLARLGVGGMGEVYLAEHKYIARRAAIKFLLPELSRSKEVVGRFFNEARAASLIEHPGIVEVLDCEVHTDGRAFIVMELLRGDNLRSYIERNGKLDGDMPGALAICAQMVSALAAAHAQGIVHRDLKPDNVFLHVAAGRSPAEPIVKLLDFGIAKLQGDGEAGNQTRTGQLLGTPLYMSPEQCRGARLVDSRADIYSLGCIMFEIFCGRPPFVAPGLGDLMIAHVTQPPPDPREFAGGLPPPIRQLLLRCLEKEPADRPTVNVLAAALEAAGARDVVRLKAPVQTAGLASPVAPVASPVAETVPEPIASMATPAGRQRAPERPLAAARPGAAPAHRRDSVPFLVTPPPTTLGGVATEVVTRLAARRRRKLIGLGTLSLAGVAVIAVVALRRPTPDALEPGAAVVNKAPAPAAPPAPAESAVPVPALPPQPATAAITLTGVPAEAIIRLDGRQVSAPLVVPRNRETHLITVDVAGHERWEQSVDGTSDRTVAVELKAKPPEGRPKAKSKQRSERSHGSRGFSGFSDL
jgi:tRNA A-37 threonylcarbamoyl transferase component Bud32